MEIRSRWKDYYDHVSHLYGVDPVVLYDRRDGSGRLGDEIELRKDDAQAFFHDTFERFAIGGRRGKGRNAVRVGSPYEMLFLVAGSHFIPLAYHDASGVTRPLGPEHDRFLERAGGWCPERLAGRRYDDAPVQPASPPAHLVEEIVRHVQAPVFVLHATDHDRSLRVHVEERVPRLSELGIERIVTAEQMWQDIYATLANVLRESPDRAPPVEVADRYRIEYAGHDLKTSFRHPINSPAAAARRRK